MGKGKTAPILNVSTKEKRRRVLRVSAITLGIALIIFFIIAIGIVFPVVLATTVGCSMMLLVIYASVYTTLYK